ncbi:MAG: DUF2480 family protein [bacterium]|nr:DUF2480 family protein [bacterium]
MSENLIENKVAKSGLLTLDLANYVELAPRVELDIKPWLFREMILKESDFRAFVKEHNWAQYQDKIVCFVCSADAIVPTWAYMLLAVSVQPFAKKYFFGSNQNVDAMLFHEAMGKIDFSQYRDVRVIVKGCGEIPVPVNAFVEITAGLLPYAKSIMYGEACSNVPVFKRRN